MTSLVFLAEPSVLAKERRPSRNLALERFKTKMDRLVKKSRESGPKCERFAKRAQKAGWLVAGQKTFSTRKDAREAMKVVRSYPGTPRATQEALGQLIGKLPKGVQETYLINTINLLENCEKIAAFQVFSKLVVSLGEFPFSKKDRDEVIRVTKYSVKRELARPGSMVSFMIQLSLVEKLIEEDLIKVSRQVHKGIKKISNDFERMLAKLRKQLRKRSASNQKTQRGRVFGSINEVLFEIRQTNRMRIRLNRIVKKL